MLTTSDVPGRRVCTVQVHDERNHSETLRACTAVLDVLRPVIATIVLDLHSDRWSEMPHDGLGGSGPLQVLPYSLFDEQRWAEEDLRALALPHRRGRWEDAMVLDAGDAEQWRLARTYSTATLGARLEDAAGRALAVLEDGGAVVTAALTDSEAQALRAAVAPGTVELLDEKRAAQLAVLLDRQEELRRRGRHERRQQEAQAARAEAEMRGRRVGYKPEPDPPHPADGYSVTASVRATAFDGFEPPSVSVALSTYPSGRPSPHARLEAIRRGRFAIALTAAEPGQWPEGGGSVLLTLHVEHTRLVTEQLELFALPPGEPHPTAPPEADGGCSGTWDGWDVHVERAGEGTVRLTTPAAWVRRGPTASTTPDGIVEVTLTLHRR